MTRKPIFTMAGANAEIERLYKALEEIASLKAGSRGAYIKFVVAQSIAKTALDGEPPR